MVVSYQFGGKHHIKKPPVVKEPPKKDPPVVKPPEPKVATPTVTVTETPTVTKTPTTQTKTVEDAIRTRIRVVEDDIDNIPPGYYVIVGVYNSPGRAYRITKEIKQKLDLDVASFLHPNNNFTYIYIDKPYDSRAEAGDRLINLLRIPEFKNSKAWILKVGKL